MAKTNTIITIGRQYGSAGREIGYKVAADLDNEAPRGRALKHLTRLRHIRALTLQILAFRLAPLGRESGVSEL